MVLSPKISTLNNRERWVLYLVLSGLPGLNVALWFGFSAAILFEIIVWIPQQRLFDSLELAKTIPFSQR